MWSLRSAHHLRAVDCCVACLSIYSDAVYRALPIVTFHTAFLETLLDVLWQSAEPVMIKLQPFFMNVKPQRRAINHRTVCTATQCLPHFGSHRPLHLPLFARLQCHACTALHCDSDLYTSTRSISKQAQAHHTKSRSKTNACTYRSHCTNTLAPRPLPYRPSYHSRSSRTSPISISSATPPSSLSFFASFAATVCRSASALAPITRE